jgi:hypothetical protein
MSQVDVTSVSRAKFDREVAAYRSIEPTLIARGWWLMKAEFPIVEVGFVTVNMRPAVLLFAVRIDFTDYDLKPLSVRFIDPFTKKILLGAEMPAPLLKRDPAMTQEQVEAARAGQAEWMAQPLALAMPGEPAFLCLPGVLEYHEHPAHSGDPWELHRASGEGRMNNILEKIWRHGTDPVIQLGMALQFHFREIPQ